MFQPSPAARPLKRIAPKPAPKGKHTHPGRPINAHVADEPTLRTEREAAWIGAFVRKSAADVIAEIETGFQHLGALLEAVDGHDQAGLHSLNIASSGFEDALRKLRRAAESAKVRGEAGYADE